MNSCIVCIAMHFGFIQEHEKVIQIVSKKKVIQIEQKGTQDLTLRRAQDGFSHLPNDN